MRYCKSTSFQANHNSLLRLNLPRKLFAILQKYEFSSKSQPMLLNAAWRTCCLRYCKSTSFQANHNFCHFSVFFNMLFAILQKYEFSSKSQQFRKGCQTNFCCLRYCKSTSFQANHNWRGLLLKPSYVVCDTAKVRVFKQITTKLIISSQLIRCLRYCKSTSFQANHNCENGILPPFQVVCDTAKVRVFKQITTACLAAKPLACCLRYCKSTSFQANHNNFLVLHNQIGVVCDTAKVRVFKQITTL